MIFTQCDNARLPAVIDFYRSVVRHLEANVNYPKWSNAHPSNESIAEAVRKGEQYICVDNGAIVGAVVLNGNPEGAYERGNWSLSLAAGEFLVIHALAVSPDCSRRGVGSFMVRQSIQIAAQKGYKALRLDVVPGNFPAERLYQKHGFRYVNTADLLRNIEGIPEFDLYELNL